MNDFCLDEPQSLIMALAVTRLGTQSSSPEEWRSPFDQAPTGDARGVFESVELFTPLAAGNDGTVDEFGCRLGETVPAGRVLRW